MSGSPTADAGLTAGDTITAVGGRSISMAKDITERCPYSVVTRGNIEVTLMVDGTPLTPADTAAG